MKKRYHPSWPKKAIDAFERCISAHGGWNTWESFQQVKLKLKTFQGMLLQAKGLSKTFEAPVEMTIDPKNREVVFDYGSHQDVFSDGKLVYSPDKIEIEDGRSIFKRSVFEKWQPQHALYFFGYAWANYIGYPFILPQFPLESFHFSEKKSYFRIQFPENFHTHCRAQTFYFGSESLLFRHDYHARFAGAIYYGCHLSEGYQAHHGIKIALTTRDRPGIAPLILPVNGIYTELAIQK